MSAILISYSDFPVCWCSSTLSLFWKTFLSKIVLNFKTSENTLFILFQHEKRVSNISSISVFTSILLAKTSFLVSRSSVSMSYSVWALFHDDSVSQRNFGAFLAILSDICSFQSDLLWNKFRIILLLSSVNGDASSSGLYIELSNDKISCLFKVLPFLFTWKYSQCSFIIGNSF